MYNVLILIIILSSCDPSTDSSSKKNTYTILDTSNPVDKGNRLFGINISENKNGFMDSFEEGIKSGLKVIELNIPWKDIEKSKGVYTDPNGILQATQFYADQDIYVSFSIAVINTNRWNIPNYLEGVETDSTLFISSFNNMISWFFSALPKELKVLSISVGNEVDLMLKTDEDWNKYNIFYEDAAIHIKSLSTTIKVGVKTTVMNGVFGNELDKVVAINAYSDVIMLNYYPQNSEFEVNEPTSARNDFHKITTLFRSKDIWFTELGYQSGSNYCKSSEEKQAHFYHYMFKAWDEHKDRIKFVLIDWLHDQSGSIIQEWKTNYGDNPKLVEYLSTLGVRTYNGEDKYAWKQILYETSIRGW